MNTVQLECFLAVAEYLNFSRAAEAVNITQPAVSHQISSLEDELGVKLFVRTNKNVYLTPEGAQFINDADSIMKIAMGAKHRLIDNKKYERIRLGIGCHSFDELEITHNVLSGLREFYPNVYPDIRNVPFKSIDNLLADDTIQVMFSLKSGNSKNGVIYRELCRCPVVCLCRSDNELAQKHSLKLNELRGCAVLNEKLKSHESLLKYQGMIASRSDSSQLYFASGTDSCHTLVKAGFGYTIAPLMPVRYSDGLIRVPISDIEPLSFGVYLRNFQDDPILKKFVEIAEEML
ncbi:MAG: LysR family transcriptional regulator [Ruminococcus sp.]|nr:LysR family transcriptional regulator [Ruminococcus sp.]